MHYYICIMKEQLTISQYAALTGVTRDTIHKRIRNGNKLAGVKYPITKIGSITILTVDKNKVNDSLHTQE